MSERNLAEARAWAALAELRDAIASGGDINPPVARFERNFDIAGDGAQGRLQDALDVLTDATADDALRVLGEIAGRARGLQQGFALGAEVASDAERDLFFPAAAAHLAQVAALLEQIEKAADGIDGNIDSLGAAFKKGDVESLINEGNAIKRTVEALVANLRGIEGQLDE